MSEPLIGISDKDKSVKVPNIKPQPTTQAEFTKVLENEASKARKAVKVPPKPSPVPLQPQVSAYEQQTTNNPSDGDVGNGGLPTGDGVPTIPQATIDAIFNREPGTISDTTVQPIEYGGFAEEQRLLTPATSNQRFDQPIQDVPTYTGQQIFRTDDPLAFGNPVADKQFQDWVAQQQYEATRMRPSQLVSQAFRPKELDPSVTGGFVPTSQNKPWWEQMMSPTTEWDPYRGKFGEYGSGAIGGVFNLLNLPQAIVQGGLSDAYNVVSSLGAGLDKGGGLLGSIFNPGKFAEGFGQNWQRNTPEAGGQFSPTNLSNTNPLVRLRNNSYTLSGIMGRNQSATDPNDTRSFDPSKPGSITFGRANPWGQRTGEGFVGLNQDANKLGLGITQGTNIQRTSNKVDEAAIRLLTSAVPGLSEQERRNRQQTYLDMNYQLGGMFRGLVIDVITGGAGEAIAAGIAGKLFKQSGKQAAEQSVRQSVREAVVQRPALPPARTAKPTNRLPAAQGQINNPRYQLPPAYRGLPQEAVPIKPRPVQPRVIVTPPNPRNADGVIPMPDRTQATDVRTVERLTDNTPRQQQQLPGTTYKQPQLPEQAQPRGINPTQPTYVIGRDGKVGAVLQDGAQSKKPINLGEAQLDKVRVRPEGVPTIEVEAQVIPEEVIPRTYDTSVSVGDTRVAKGRLRRKNAVDVQSTDVTQEVRPRLQGSDPNAPRLNPASDPELKIPLPELTSPQTIRQTLTDWADNFNSWVDNLTGKYTGVQDLSRPALPEGKTPEIPASKPLPDLAKIDPEEARLLDTYSKGLMTFDEYTKLTSKPEPLQLGTDQRLLPPVGYVQREPGIVQSQVAVDAQKVREVLRVVDKETPVETPMIKAPDELKVVDAEVFSPQYSLRDFAKLVSSEQPGAVYNQAALKRGERTVASLIDIGKRITLPDGTTLLHPGTKPATVNTFAKLMRRVEKSLEQAGVPLTDRPYYRQIFSRNGVPIPDNLPDNLIIRVGKAKPDGTPETLVVSPKLPDIPLSPDYGVATPTVWRDGKLVQADAPMKVMPAVGERNWKPWVYQKDLPDELVAKSPEGVDLTVVRAETEENIAFLSDEYQQAKRTYEQVTQQLEDELKKLEKVPDAGARTLLDNPGKVVTEPPTKEPSSVVAKAGDTYFHGTRVADLDLSNADPLVGASRSELGTAIYLTKNVDEATAKATADVNRHLPPLSGRTFGDGVVHETRINPSANIIPDTYVLDDNMKRIFLDATDMGYGFEEPKVVKALSKALDKPGVTLRQAFAYLDKAVLKFTGDIREVDLRGVQRDIVENLRLSGIDGVSSVDTVAVYNPKVIKTIAKTGIGEVEDTLQHAVAKLTSDSLAAARNPESPFLKASHAESKVRTLSELQEVAESELKKAQERLTEEVQKLTDIDNKLEELSTGERKTQRRKARERTERSYQSFKRELNKPGDTPCL